ncbi:MAG: hypothetical protein Q9220_002630 [cf. Caloplaca sp. 1 TL-2023]
MDSTFVIFHRREHPFIVVGTQANTWSGVNSMPREEIDVLVRSSSTEAIIKDLVVSREWEVRHNPDPPEELYKLCIDCAKVEVPDVLNKGCVLIEEQYYPDPHQRFGPSPASTHQRNLLPVLQIRAKFRNKDIPICIPSIQDHLNALLSQSQMEMKSGRKTGNAPRVRLRNYVRYLFFDWAPQREWILATVVAPEHRAALADFIARYRSKQLILFDPVTKKPVFDKMPWELVIREVNKDIRIVKRRLRRRSSRIGIFSDRTDTRISRDSIGGLGAGESWRKYRGIGTKAVGGWAVAFSDGEGKEDEKEEIRFHLVGAGFDVGSRDRDITM